MKFTNEGEDNKDSSFASSYAIAAVGRIWCSSPFVNVVAFSQVVKDEQDAQAILFVKFSFFCHLLIAAGVTPPIANGSALRILALRTSPNRPSHSYPQYN